MRAFAAQITLDMQLKKILITFVDTFTILSNLEREFRELGIEVEVFITNDSGHWLNRYLFKKINRIARKLKLIAPDRDLFERSKFSFEKYREDQFAKKIAQFKPDLIFCIHGHKFAEAVLRDTPIPKIGWWIEPNPNLQTLIRYAKLFDLYLSYDSEIVDLLKSLNIHSEYQSHVASPVDFYPISGLDKDIDILFYGAYSPWREQVLYAAYQATKNIALFGSDWMQKCTLFQRQDLEAILRGREIAGSGLNEMINRSKIVLAAQRLKGATTGLDTRAFDILASGALLLTDAPKDLFLHFDHREDLVVYDRAEDLPDLIKMLLAGEIEINKIRQSGREKVMQNSTYQALCQKIAKKYSDGFFNRNID